MTLRLGFYSQDHYGIQAIIGIGSMAKVYRAFCHKLQYTVAIEVLKQEYSDNEDFIRRFTQRALAATKVNHPNLVNVYGVEHADDICYIVTESVDGITLREYIRQKDKLEQQEAIGIAVQVADGLGEVHRQGIVHRGVKSQNMVVPSGDRARLTDFGVVHAASTETLSQESMGSVHYISPEHAQGESTDAHSNFYLLGTCLYEMVTEHVPFGGEETATALLAQTNQKPMPPCSLNPEISEELNYIILKSLEKRLTACCQNMAELIQGLKVTSRNSGDILPRVQETYGTGSDIILFYMADVIERASQADDAHEETAEGEEETEDEETSPTDRCLNKLIKDVGFVLPVPLLDGGIVVGLILSGMLRKEPAVAESESTEIEPNSVLSGRQAYMPYLTALSSDKAEEKLRADDLTLVIQSRKNSDQFEKDVMMEQESKAGAVVQKHSKAYMTPNLGTAEIELSELNLVGTEEEDAKKTPAEEGSFVEEKNEYSDTIEKGKVIHLGPEKVKKGDIVTLVLSFGKGPEGVRMSNLTYGTEDSVKQTLTEVGLTLSIVTKKHSDTAPQGQVTRQSVSDGTEIGKGKSVNLVLSEGPKVTAVESTQTSEATSCYVTSIDTNFTLSDLIGPDSDVTSITVTVRFRQGINDQIVYRTLMEPRTIQGDAILPPRSRTIEGAYSVDTGYAEIVRTGNGQVLRSFDVRFFKMQ